jgi:diadenylate cyclase
VRAHLGDNRLLVAAEDPVLRDRFKKNPELTVLDLEPGEASKQDRLNFALLEAVRTEKLRHGSDVVVLYNGVEVDEDAPEPIDSLSIIHLGEHLEKFRPSDLRMLETTVPLDTLRAVVSLALAVGREGREGHKVGTMFVIGDHTKVLAHCRPMNFNPFRGYSLDERDVKSKAVREQIKDLAQLEGAIIIRRDGTAEAACMQIEAPMKGVTLSKGFGTRHAAAAAISKHTKAVAIAVSQSSGSVRIFHDGEQVLHLEPFAKRPLRFGPVQLDSDGNGALPAASGRSSPARRGVRAGD